MTKEIEQKILMGLLRKYYKRALRKEAVQISRRIILKVTEIWREYENTNADIERKLQINESAQKLKEMDFITIDCLKFSDDIEKIYLNEKQITEIEAYLELHFGVAPRTFQVDEIRKLINSYQNKGKLTSVYCHKLAELIEKSTAEIDLVKEDEILLMLDFLQDNKKDLYIREASMLVYGTSKHFEESRLESVVGIIKEASGEENINEVLPEDTLQRFHVYFPEQDVFLKGDFLIELDDYIIETKFFYGGLTISAKDIQRMRRVIANTPNVLTIENRTAFLRMNNAEYSLIYLGGYAKRSQIHFIKRLYQDNPHIDYHHFGDIDVGGLQIHQHLCSATGIGFKMFHMGVDELNDKRFQNCLSPLSTNDLERIEILRNVPLYQDVIGEMLKKKAKLEQEIVCLMLEEDADGSSEQF